MDLFDLAVKITLDKAVFDKSLKDAQGDVNSASNNMSNGFSKIAGAVKTLGKVSVASFGLASTAVVSLTKKSVAAYKEYQQLVGGVETLFGTQGMSLEKYAESVGQTVEQAQEKYNALAEAQDMVKENARNAFKTAGMSVNEYMEMATSTAAAMVSSLNGDTVKAAKLTDQAIRDMSDNANKMGTSMESIQFAYNGFAKGNFTMLDNLKLGFGGTKEEMQRLLDKASEISGFKYDISSYADIVDAIHVVQEEMGITGTTAAEAAHTVSGSAGSMKAAWENLVLAIADGDNNIRDEIDDLVASAEAMVNNLVPVITQALSGIADFVTEIAPVVAKKLPGLIAELLPQFLNAAGAIIAAIVESLPAMLDAIVIVIGSVVDSISAYLNEKSPILGAAFDALVDLGKTAFTALGNLWSGEGGLKEKWGDITVWVSETLIPAVSEKWEQVKEIVGDAFTRIKALWDGEDGLKSKWEDITLWVSETLLPMVTEKWELIKEAIGNAFSYIKNLWDGEEGLKSKWEGITAWLSETFLPMVSEGWTLIQEAVGGVFAQLKALWDGEGGLQGIWNSIIDFINNNLRPTFEDRFDSIMRIVKTSFTAIKDAWNNVLKPALMALWGVFSEVVIPIVKDVAKKFNELKNDTLKKVADYVEGPLSTIWSTLTTFFSDVLIPVVQLVAAYFKVFYEQVISPMYEFLRDKFNKIWEQFTTWWTETGSPKMEELKTAFGTFRDQYLVPLAEKVVMFKSAMNTLWENVLKPVAEWITDTFQVAIEGLEGVFGGLIDFLTGVFTGDWDKAWGGIRDIFGAVWDSIVELAKGPINTVIDFINSLISAVETALNAIIGGFNKIHVSIPNWVPKIGGSYFGINIPYVDFGELNYLAKGGHLLRGDAIVGEAGPELLHRENGQTTVIPLSGGERDVDGLMGGNTYNFNIYPSPAQAPLEIAQEVQRIFVEWEHQKEVAYV